MTYGRFGVLFGLAFLAACAKNPDEIPAADVEPTTYAQKSCRGLTQERVMLSVDVENLTAKQKSAASADALGVLFTRLPIASLAGNDHEAQLAVAKGPLQSVASARAANGCN